MKKYSFKKGFNQLRLSDVDAAKAKIMKALNITTRAAWSDRLNGRVEPRVSEAEAIENIFKKYGITEIWGR